jgi:predicted nucleotidyltransferase
LRGRRSDSVREKVAREAAVLLYTEQEKEYKQAKCRAAKTLRTKILPSNRDVALELDKVAEEIEGSARRERLAQMRKDALSLMVVLGDLHPRLVGSVWRGTAGQNSDIDIEVFFSDPKIVTERLEKGALKIRKAEWQSITKGDVVETAFHIFIVLQSGYEVELIVRVPEKMGAIEKDEIYGDTIRGLDMHKLRKVLLEDPFRKFVPT